MTKTKRTPLQELHAAQAEVRNWCRRNGGKPTPMKRKHVRIELSPDDVETAEERRQTRGKMLYEMKEPHRTRALRKFVKELWLR
jgi:hypothetical protein